jgi:uncharacterized protein (DUF697 family)
MSKSNREKIREKIRTEITEIENRSDMTDDKKVSRISHICCATCAGVAIQPIPFADIFILTPIQAYFATRIAAIRGVRMSESEAIDWVKEIIGIMGLGFIAQQLAIGVWKLVTFGAGGLLTLPLVYALSFAIMKVADAYFSGKSRGEKLSDEMIKDIWKRAFKEGKTKGQQEEDQIKGKENDHDQHGEKDDRK